VVTVLDPEGKEYLTEYTRMEPHKLTLMERQGQGSEGTAWEGGTREVVLPDGTKLSMKKGIYTDVGTLTVNDGGLSMTFDDSNNVRGMQFEK
jgi:hypothetical protein